MRFLDVKTDFAFKKVFGSQTSTAILEYPPEHVICELTIVDPYQKKRPQLLDVLDDANISIKTGSSVTEVCKLRQL